MGNKNSAAPTFIDTVGYAVIIVKQHTVIGEIARTYYVNDYKQINEITRIYKENMEIDVSIGKKKCRLNLSNREPVERVFLNVALILKEQITSDDKVYFFPTRFSIYENKPVKYQFVNGVLTKIERK